ncbi:TPA: hypothetical protein N0F65_008144 [Lagenidium giganteum]|uniref:Myosin-like protein n=1 Tax=Lagenidium giganteum TaxID=4803 RepID=A0AAV2YKN4_9STRA|nr:TPA: hypothetical protein N0F65_008144 [Lagenidium giganteum]
MAIDAPRLSLELPRDPDATCAPMMVAAPTAERPFPTDCGAMEPQGDDDLFGSTGSDRTSGTGEGDEDDTPRNTRQRLNPEEVFQRNIVGILNKRGYNVCDTILAAATDTSDASTASFASNSSSISSVILGLREPNHGQGPLHIAVRRGDCQVIDAILFSDCADDVVNATDNNGNTALHFAAGSWRRPQCATMVRSLLDAGADSQIKNKRGLTPIGVHMLTAKVDNPAVLIMLLESGADPDTEVEGASLLHIAARRDFAAMAGILVAFGASMSALNRDGLMCYEVASSRVKRFMLRSINSAPPFLPITQRSKCMRCSSPLMTTTKVLSNFFRRLLGFHVSEHQCNCYHCGLLFCSKCLKHAPVADVLPNNFTRSRADDLSSVKACLPCENILSERQLKHSASKSFDNSLLGFGPGA